MTDESFQLSAMAEAILFASGEPVETVRLAQALGVSVREIPVIIQQSRRMQPLSNAAMETLTIIAYNQPVSKGFVERVRGIDSSSVVNSLADKGLIEEAGRIDVPGHPIGYRTTDLFLRVFGLHSLEELPDPKPAESSENFRNYPVDSADFVHHFLSFQRSRAFQFLGWESELECPIFRDSDSPF